ncbi:MAG TPA: hypothetical protein P5205_04860 [Candidatus Paceibacterota bacterium]|nr:hypothetical protein [Verrucomicrobiota bacterium]HSA09683.1 hypothetical protein [Candidatus Paceibacterota bacterium]
MKKMILSMTILAIAAAGAQTVWAGGHHGGCGGGGWSTAAAVVGGVTAGLIVGQALAPRPSYYVAPAPVCYPAMGYGYTYYAAPPVRPAVVYPAPVPVVYAAPAPAVVYRPPVCVARPVVSFSFGYGGHRRGYW